MCGFFSIISKEDKKNSDLNSSKILNSFRWRGPDDTGVWQDHNALLIHARLSIIDLSENGHQPMVCEDNRLVISYNGEVYNWKEIRASLKYRNWKSNTDTETVLQAYKELGVDCLDLLNGMFSFSIWDRKKKTLFIARDRAGIKPLYWSLSEDKFLCGSEIKPFFEAGIEKKLNYKTLGEYLKWGVVDHGKGTFFDGIYSLSPGTYALIKADNPNVVEKRYWDVFKNGSERNLLSLSDAQEKFEWLLKDSISLQSQADVPVGTSLSGGIDSSVLTACASNQLGRENITAFTYCFGKGEGEGDIAARTAEILGVKHVKCILDHKEIPDYLCKVLFFQESPVTSIRVLAHHRLFEVSAQHGVKVLLEGSGGDEMAAGYEYYYLPYIMDLLKNSSTKNVLVELNAYMDKFNIPESSRLERLVDCLKTTLQPGVSTQDGVSFVAPHCFDQEYFHDVSAPNFDGHFPDWLRKTQWIDFAHTVLPKALRYTDRASMSSSSESRVPILDHRLVDLAFNSSIGAKMSAGNQRIFMKSSAKHILPESILKKPKQTIVDPQRTWLKSELKEWVFDLLNSNTARNLGFLNVENINSEYEKYIKEDNPRTSAHLFQYINIIKFYEVFFEKGIQEQ